MKLIKKLTAIIILLSMLITLNSPIISYAEGEEQIQQAEQQLVNKQKK